MKGVGISFVLLLLLCCGRREVQQREGQHSSVAYMVLSEIDSLMWQQRPDSAFAVLQRFAESDEADSLNEFNGHYCQLLIAELLYKNHCKQSNRMELVKAVRYFDSIVGMDGATQTNVFLAARAHYINGVGYYERDSVVKACAEYLKTLEIMETHFPHVETQNFASLQVGHLPRFMGLTYSRLAELFSGQFMQEPAIACCRKSLGFYARFIVDNTATEGESNAQVSALGNMFQKHLQWEKEWQLARERQLAQQRRTRNLATAAAVLLALGLGLWWWTTRRKKEHEAETQTLNEEKQQLQTQRDDALQQLQTQADDALQQTRAMLSQRVNEIYSSKVPNRLERIMAEFEAAYPKTTERLAAAYPELNEAERQIAVLNFLHFRAKEMADLIGLSQNTVNKYRSNLRKKTENASFSALLD